MNIILSFQVRSLLVWLFFSTGISAAPPTLMNLTPRGAERGKPMEIVATGTNLSPLSRLIFPFKATQTLLPEAKPNPAQVRFQINIDPAVPLGIYPLWLMTEEGISSFFLFSVDAFANTNEVEDNSIFDKAQKVTIPAIITGQCAGGDVDYYQFAAKKSQRLVVEVESARLGSAVLPQIRVTDARQRFITADDSQALKGDCRAIITIPADGDYVVEISDSRYRGGTPPHYRLKIADYDVIEEVYPLGGRRGEVVEFFLRGGTLAKATSIQRILAAPWTRDLMRLSLDGAIKPGMASPLVAVGDLPERLWIKSTGKDPKALDVLPPLVINSRLEHKGDTDRFQFPVQAGQRFRISVQAEELGSSLDGVLRVKNQGGVQLTLVDDVTEPPPGPGQPAIQAADPSLDLVVPAGTSLLVVELRDQRYRGGINYVYRLTLAPIIPDFLVQLPVTEFNIPRGGSAVLNVPLIRRGYLGPIQLTIPTLPVGFSVQGGHVGPGLSAGILTLTAPPQAALSAPLFLTIQGRAVSEGNIVHQATQKQVLSKEANVAAATMKFSQFPLGLAAAEPFTVQGPPTVVEAVLGYPAAIPVTVTRTPAQPAYPVEVTAALPAPVPGQPPALFTVKPAAIAMNSNTASFTLTPVVTAPEGNQDLPVQGKAKINNADRIVTGPAVAVNLLRPFTVESASSSLMLLPGQTMTIKCKVKRQPVFKEPVQFKLDGLPAGVTLAAPPKSLAAAESDFQIDLKADPKAVLAMANLTLTCSTTIAGAAYTHPPVIFSLQLKAK